MDNKELLAYRKQLFNDAVRMEKKPDRTPHIANFWTWMILDAGYKLSETLHNWDMLEKSTLEFERKYDFDMLVCDGVRDPMSVVEPIGQSSYVVDDEKEIITTLDVPYMGPDDYDLMMSDYKRFLWEVALPNKCKRFNSGTTLEDFGKVINEFN